MRTAVISDIHGNLEALEAVAAFIDESKVDATVCLGDLVGYGANPEECVNLVRTKGWSSILGNHDAAVIDEKHRILMNQFARSAIEWTADHLSNESKKYLETLPMTLPVGSNGFASHGLSYKPEDWLYSDDHNLVVASLINRAEKTLFCGHLHYAHAYTLVEDQKKLFFDHTPEKVDVKDHKVLINVGSVGQPRDDDHRSCVVVIDESEGVATFTRVQYDTAAAAKKIVDAGLPESLANRLFLGR